MRTYILRHGNDKFILRRKNETLSNDFTYTESGNDITIQSYTGSNTDVKIIDRVLDNFMLVRPTKTYKVNIDGYLYEKDSNGVVRLIFYNGENTNVDAPILEGE